ncbi:uncharacterized protein F4822DRAFT_425964 [Hypoxylon trugodes]|uniref:uncharacterized protein n=1 Tax=Hypoxylon trugodes TaxID=326681 RepID=UPI00219A3BB8|nr:uncharacterized protein F4822DRAFT_425964 [Hypoxylon trugodes]KAI1392757.1 hypothetical protein F4822DRAFT_425964 [Hypoxylon trugodes]
MTLQSNPDKPNLPTISGSHPTFALEDNARPEVTTTSATSAPSSASASAASAAAAAAVAASTRPFARAARQRHFPLANDTAGPVNRILEEYSTEIGHYGLTPAAAPHQQSFVGDSTVWSLNESNTRSRTNWAASRANTTVVQQSHCTTTSATTQGKGKRLPEGEPDDRETNRRALKKPRARLTPPRKIDLKSYPKPTFPPKLADGLTSPLFFSHRNRPPIARPLSFSGSEGATMLKSVRDGTEVTTLKLARGTVSSTSPGRSSSTPGSWSSIDAGNLARSPESLVSTPGLQALQGIGVLELLERDDRPTFIVDILTPIGNTSDPLALLYANPALQFSDSIRQLLSVDSRDSVEARDEFIHFKSWVKSGGGNVDEGDIFLPSFRYGGFSWTCSTIRNRYRFVSVNTSVASIARTSPEPLLDRETSIDSRTRDLTPIAQAKSPSGDIVLPDRDYFSIANPIEVEGQLRRDVSSDGEISAPLHYDDGMTPEAIPPVLQPSFDWTRIPFSQDLPEHIQFARTRDWASTPLGPIETWSSELRAMANMVMGSPNPAAMYWGPEFTTMYNEAYVALAGAKHPSLMGQNYKDAWGELWPELQPILESAWKSGQATMKNDDRLILRRNGFDEETFFSWSIVPLVGNDGSVVGLFNPAFENTRRKVAERRMLTLREVGERTALARDVKSFWSQVNKGLEYNEDDIPFNLVYSVTEDSDSDVSSMHSGSWVNPPQLMLEASLGVPQGHPLLVESLNLRTSSEGFAPYMRESMSKSGQPVILSADDGSLPDGLMNGLAWRGPGDACKSIVIFPVHPTTGSESVVGFIVMGVNPRRPYDEDYQLFINLLSRQLATSLASVVLFEEEIRRGQKAAQIAAADRQELTKQLHLRTQEVEESELKFTRMAEFAPVGMFIADEEGHITYSNDMWWDISRHNRSSGVDTWMESVKDEDRPALQTIWRCLLRDKIAITHEFRFKCSRHEGENVIDTWVLMSAYPEKDADGGIKGIFGCVTNISQQKLAEQIQMQRREEAVELKRQQENFIDITSHEMRNPLSAILQCADEISGTLSNIKPSGETNGQKEALRLAMEGCMEAANTITLCASHQKRIVDDILTLSKLDSQLLLVTPVDVQPLAVVQRVLKMFESELNTNGIEMKFQVKNRYLDMGIDWVKLDPSRLLQVLINLMTNAIKFTQSRPQRSIVVTLDASSQISERTDSGIQYFPSDRADRDDMTDQPEWGNGDKINLHFSVQDTGRGLDEHERKLLFQRFSQATPRTHVQYGGSGLGLFISRILTELQGGQIGVTSQKGIGSTFSFYIQSRKADGPSPDAHAALPIAPPLTRAPGSSTTIETRHPKTASQEMLSRSAKSIASKPRYSEDGRRLFDVLIVEDNLVNQKVLQRSLRNVGNSTKVANHGGEALEVLQQSRYWTGKEESGEDISVILMDLEMPVMDGMTCARKIRELERNGTIVSHIPIIAVTAYARPEQIENAKAAGVDDVISKPFRMPELIPRIEQLVAVHTPYAEALAA